MRDTFVYSYNIKTHAMGFNELLERIFCILLVVETSSLQKVVKMLEEVVDVWQEVRWIQQMRQNFTAQFVQVLKHWLFDIRSSIVTGKNRAHSIDTAAGTAVFSAFHQSAEDTSQM